MTTTEIPDHLIEKAARRMSTCRTFEPDLCGGCAKRLDEARAALYAVADDLRAEGAREAKAEALREAARYFAGGLHCADMRYTPEETVRELNRRADRIEKETR